MAKPQISFRLELQTFFTKAIYTMYMIMI